MRRESDLYLREVGVGTLDVRNWSLAPVVKTSSKRDADRDVFITWGNLRELNSFTLEPRTFDAEPGMDLLQKSSMVASLRRMT